MTNHIKNFREFFINESYTEIGDSEKKFDTTELLNIIERECSDVINSPIYVPFFRGLSPKKYKNSFYIIDSFDFERKSQKYSCHNLIIDNDSAWSDYPKRHKSIICSESQENSMQYGNSYLIIPFNFNKIGICPESDMWFSFVDYNEETFDTNEFWNYLIEEIVNDKLHPDTPFVIDTFMDLSKMCKFINSKKDELKRIDTPSDNIFAYEVIKKFSEDTESKDFYEDYLSQIFNPETNMFLLEKNYINASNKLKKQKLKGGHELWYSGKSLAIQVTPKLNVSFYKSYLSEIIKTGKDFHEFIKNHITTYYDNKGTV